MWATGFVMNFAMPALLHTARPINLEFRKWVEIYLRIRSLPKVSRLSLKFYVSAASFTNWVSGACRAMLHSPPATTRSSSQASSQTLPIGGAAT
jgi:hypothetical protein